MQHALPESNRNYGQEERRISSVLPYNALFSETERERGRVNYDNPSVADAGLVLACSTCQWTFRSSFRGVHDFLPTPRGNYPH